MKLIIEQYSDDMAEAGIPEPEWSKQISARCAPFFAEVTVTEEPKVNWLRRWLAHRRRRRSERWFGNMRERKVVFTSPKYMRSLRK